MKSCSSGSLLLSMLGFIGKPLPHTEHWVKKNHISPPGLAAHLSPFTLYSQEQKFHSGSWKTKQNANHPQMEPLGIFLVLKSRSAFGGRWRSRQWAGNPGWPQGLKAGRWKMPPAKGLVIGGGLEIQQDSLTHNLQPSLQMRLPPAVLSGVPQSILTPFQILF